MSNWIKMQTCLRDSPKVDRITDILDNSEAETIGALFILWSIADTQTEDGQLQSMTTRMIDRKTGVTGFADALVQVGWLVVEEEGVTLPNFGDHNGSTAKSRASNAKRVANYKSRNGKELPKKNRANGEALPTANAKPLPNPLPREEKRREEENREGESAQARENPPPQSQFLEPNQNVKDAKAIIDGINPDWSKAGGWSPTEERELMDAMNYILTLPLDTIEALKTYRSTATDTFHQKYFLNRNLFIRKMSELAQASLAQKPKPKRTGRGGGPSKMEDFLKPQKT